MDFHSDETSLSGFIGGKALYNIKEKFQKIYILGVRDIEPGELENLKSSPHVSLAGDAAHIPYERCHLHIDGDVLDPAINPVVDHPVKHGWSLDLLKNQIAKINYESSSVSNLDGRLLRTVQKILYRYSPGYWAYDLFYW